VIAVADWLYFQIPLYATVLLTVLAVGYRLYLSVTSIMRWQDFWLAIATGVGLATFLGIILVVTRGKGMGEGDLHVALPMGVLLGWPRGLVGLYVAFVTGAIYGIWLLAMKKRRLRQQVPFGPFLVAGTIVALIWGGQVWDVFARLMG
jgi:leader peptidase (prepilin peptidase)/N-methyltransferase